ncbi:LOW QUALITY PROTEIN: hypothetical protein ACHAWF_004689 [Thalassiosira exigua]
MSINSETNVATKTPLSSTPISSPSAPRSHFTPYVISPSEADTQVGRRRERTVAVTRDGDLIAYDHELVVIVDSYAAKDYRVVDIQMPVEEEMKKTLLFYYYYHWFGLRVIH